MAKIRRDEQIASTLNEINQELVKAYDTGHVAAVVVVNDALNGLYEKICVDFFDLEDGEEIRRDLNDALDNIARLLNLRIDELKLLSDLEKTKRRISKLSDKLLQARKKDDSKRINRLSGLIELRVDDETEIEKDLADLYDDLAETYKSEINSLIDIAQYLAESVYNTDDLFEGEIEE